VNWRIDLPHRSRADSLLDVGAMARHLPDPERAKVTRELALAASWS
jgi:hypothetical protein